jgi:hypothetical protein
MQEIVGSVRRDVVRLFSTSECCTAHPCGQAQNEARHFTASPGEGQVKKKGKSTKIGVLNRVAQALGLTQQSGSLAVWNLGV